VCDIIMPVIMSHEFVNIAAPIRLRFAVVSGTWAEWEESDEVEHAWEFTQGPMDANVTLDAWEVRKEFLGLRHDQRDALRSFLLKTGAFCWLNPYRPIADSELWQFQAAIRRQLLKPTVSENRTKTATEFEAVIHNRIQVHLMSINVGLEDGTLVGEAEALNTFDAILSTIFIDRLRKLRYEVCERPDCAAIYELTSRHERKYCSYDCAHLMTVRRSRKGRRKKNQNKKKILKRRSPADASIQGEFRGPPKQ
jgi:hypothetical protein